MYNKLKVISAGILVCFATNISDASANTSDRLQPIQMGGVSRAPIGWVEFCADNSEECEGQVRAPRDIALTARSWKELTRINAQVNASVKPLTDAEHFGVLERWSYPDDGYGDCEDYVLLKKRLLVEAGFPREALLITVVRDEKGDGHAVLTAKTDKGEFVLDNQNPAVLAWSETKYRFVKRQSQSDPNVWMALGDTRPAVATASSR
jgi:predicted transglutaminase-like cysteine proteinase